MELEKDIGVIEKNSGSYSLGQILGLWALGALPIALLAWVVAPAVIPYIPLHPGITYWCLMILGMAWQFGVSLVVVYRELGTLRWADIRWRTWLQSPRDPVTGVPDSKLFWWLLPCLLFSGLVNLGLDRFLDAPVAWIFPALKVPVYTDISRLVDPQFKGQWWLLCIFLVSALLNYFLGEEFLFRGVLLPKMKDVFGKWDWVANAVLFGLYHLHKPWAIPDIIISSLAATWPARRFQSNWMAVIVHGIEGLVVFVLVMGVILGLIS